WRGRALPARARASTLDGSPVDRRGPPAGCNRPAGHSSILGRAKLAAIVGLGALGTSRHTLPPFSPEVAARTRRAAMLWHPELAWVEKEFSHATRFAFCHQAGPRSAHRARTALCVGACAAGS